MRVGPEVPGGSERLTRVVAELDLDVRPGVLTQLGGVLDRLDATLVHTSEPKHSTESGRAARRVSTKPAQSVVQSAVKSVAQSDVQSAVQAVVQSVVRAEERSTVQPRLVQDGGAYTVVLDAEAAYKSRRGAPTPPLAGLTIAVKDLIAVAGYPLGAGSVAWRGGNFETQDALIVGRLRELGAVIVGLTALHEVAFGVTGINDVLGWPRNPHDPRRIPGGSSSGSAVAVVEGSAEVAVGTDTGGSLRIPAALCGAVGYKPSFGTYATHGVLPLSPTLDHVGLLAARVALIRRVHAALGFDPGQARVPARVGVAIRDVEESDEPVTERVRECVRTLERAGARVVDLALPDPDLVFAVSTAVMFTEAAAVHRSIFQRRCALYGEDVRNRLLQGLAIPAATYAAALRERTRLKALTTEALGTVDCVIGPTVGLVAPREVEARDPTVAARLVRNTRLANVVGAPALSLPLPGHGLPMGLQIMALDDASLLGWAAGIERVIRRR